MAIILGRIWHEYDDGQTRYLNLIDQDNQKAIEEILTFKNGEKHTIQELSQKTIVEQHDIEIPQYCTFI